ncbi:hypothetical protein F230042K4_03790 [Mediterraneibacter glycyrrhizinilyticus]
MTSAKVELSGETNKYRYSEIKQRNSIKKMQNCESITQKGVDFAMN